LNEPIWGRWYIFVDLNGFRPNGLGSMVVDSILDSGITMSGLYSVVIYDH